jgi:superfamily II DNA/RNA helicase
MVFLCEQRKKIETLRKIIHGVNIQKALIFLNKPDDLELAVKRLNFHGLPTAALFGSASKQARQQALHDFRAGRVTLLAASDLAARGLHINGLTHVINLDVPENPSFYLHRAGRAGRMGQTGTAITIATQREMAFVKNIEKQYVVTIAQKEMRLGDIVDTIKIRRRYHV